MLIDVYKLLIDHSSLLWQTSVEHVSLNMSLSGVSKMQGGGGARVGVYLFFKE